VNPSYVLTEGIQCFQCLLDPPVKPEDDKY
jgi:hypothetical protein